MITQSSKLFLFSHPFIIQAQLLALLHQLSRMNFIFFSEEFFISLSKPLKDQRRLNLLKCGIKQLPYSQSKRLSSKGLCIEQT